MNKELGLILNSNIEKENIKKTKFSNIYSAYYTYLFGYTVWNIKINLMFVKRIKNSITWRYCLLQKLNLRLKDQRKKKLSHKYNL